MEEKEEETKILKEWIEEDKSCMEDLEDKILSYEEEIKRLSEVTGK